MGIATVKARPTAQFHRSQKPKETTKLRYSFMLCGFKIWSTINDYIKTLLLIEQFVSTIGGVKGGG